jgi:hypothetical protein
LSLSPSDANPRDDANNPTGANPREDANNPTGANPSRRNGPNGTSKRPGRRRMIGCSSEGEESVKAGDGLDEAATNSAAPAMAASKPVRTRRETIVSSVFPKANRIQNSVLANLVPNRLGTMI